MVKFEKVVVCGAGVMGAQIAAHLSNTGCSVALLDLENSEGDRNARAKGAVKMMGKMKPAPFDGSASAANIQVGNFADHLQMVVEADWVIEAVVENLDIKRGLLEKIASHRKGHTLVSTNTSGIPLKTLSEGMPEDFLSHFCGVHFFNPPRYLRLLEVIPGEKTNADLMQALCNFGRVHLGKGVVMAKDTPNFIGNRIGIYAMCKSMEPWVKGDFNVESIDALTGPLIGRPKSATFRTADVVGLDTYAHVTNNLYGAVSDDDEREAFKLPELVQSMLDKGLLGAKVKKGFYSKVKKDILVLDRDELDYVEQNPEKFEELKDIAKERSLAKRLQALYDLNTSAGEFLKDHLLSIFAYSAKRIPEIADDPESIDLAMKYGFGWQMGPFEMWDAIGFDKVMQDLKAKGAQLPAWLDDMPSSRFYKPGEEIECYQPSTKAFRSESRSSDEWQVADLERKNAPVLLDHPAAKLYDIGDGVALLSYKTKANAYNRDLIEACRGAIARVNDDKAIKGMVVANDGDLFSAGADLASMIGSFQKGDMAEIEQLIVDFQQLGQHFKYSPKPMVLSAHGRALGGGLEMLMASPEAVVSSEMYVGLVELGVGLLPAGGGCLRMVQRAMELAPSPKPVHVSSFIEQHFLSIALAKVSSGVMDGIEMGYLPKNVTIVRNTERRMAVAKAKVQYLSEMGYRPPRPSPVLALGQAGYAKMMTMVRQYVEAGYATEYDGFLCSQVAKVMSGGDGAAPKFLPEQAFLDLEMRGFMTLINEKKSQERIESMIFHKKPLRN